MWLMAKGLGWSETGQADTREGVGMGDKYSCLMASTFFSTTLLGNWDED